MPNILDKIVVGKEEFVDQTNSIKTAIQNLKPSSYVTEVVKTEVNRTIVMTLFNKDASPQYKTVTFQYGFTAPTFADLSGNVTDSTILTTYLSSNYIPLNQKGVANGVATLNAEGKVDPTQIAGSVAEIKEGYYYNGEFYQDLAHTIPIAHNSNYIYFDLSDNTQYRWGGSTFIQVATSLTVNSARGVGLPTNAYRADFGASNYQDILALQSGKQNLLNSTNKLNPAYVATDENNRFVTDAQIYAFEHKQNALTFDTAPTEGSTNPVTSGGIYTYIDNRIVGALVFKGSVPNYSNLPTLLNTPDIQTGWEYNVIATNNLYAAVVDRTVTPATLSWNLMGNSVSLQGYVKKVEVNVANGVAGLDNNAKIPASLLTNAVTGIKGDAETDYRTGLVNLTKANIGLGNVDNTSDMDKPVSTAVQTAIALVEANQLYKTHSQGSFATKAELTTATTFYNADGTVATPTKNDVAYVLADEDHNGKTAKYVIASISGTTITWGFVIAFVDTQFTEAQMNAINSGITADKVLHTVDDNTDQTIDGTKTFNASPVIKGGIIGESTGSQHTYLFPDYDGTLVVDSDIENAVYTEGEQTITGEKTFATSIKFTVAEAFIYTVGENEYTITLPEKSGTLALAEDNLPLAGGQMTGSIVHAENGTVVAIKGVNDTTNNAIAYGGTDYNNGASLWLGGKDFGGEASGGGFGLDACDGTNRRQLIGLPNGNLYWNDKLVALQEYEMATVNFYYGHVAGYITACRSSNNLIINMQDIDLTYSGGVGLLATITLPTGWKMINDSSFVCYGFMAGEMRSDQNYANGIKVWASGWGTNIVTLSIWATTSKHVYQGCGQIVVPIYKE